MSKDVNRQRNSRNFVVHLLASWWRNRLTPMTTWVTCIPAHVFPKVRRLAAFLSTQRILTKNEKEDDLKSESTWASLVLSEHLWVFLNLSGPLSASLDLSGSRDPLFTQCSARVLGKQWVHLKRDRTQRGCGSPMLCQGIGEQRVTSTCNR